MNRSMGWMVGGMVLLAAGAQAQTLKPGLWEISNKMQSASGEMEKAMAEMQKQLAAMTPEQRKMMQGMMAGQGGGMAMGAGGAMSIKACLTKEMIERNEVASQEGDCKHSMSPRSGNSMKFSFVCKQPPSNGEGTVTFVSAEAYNSKMAITTSAGGRNEKINMDSQGKWLSAECGTVKPMTAKK